MCDRRNLTLLTWVIVCAYNRKCGKMKLVVDLSIFVDQLGYVLQFIKCKDNSLDKLDNTDFVFDISLKDTINFQRCCRRFQVEHCFLCVA